MTFLVGLLKPIIAGVLQKTLTNFLYKMTDRFADWLDEKKYDKTVDQDVDELEKAVEVVKKKAKNGDINEADVKKVRNATRKLINDFGDA